MDSSKPLLECSSRGDAVHLPYGEAPDGRLVRVSEVPSGLACRCTCPACRTPLVARRGGTRIAHFAHLSDRACTQAYETTLHKLAKQLIADGAALGLPEVAAEHDGRRRIVRPAATVRPEAVALEPGLDGLRPDILVSISGRPLLIEVAVTHFCTPDKVALIRKRRLAAVEIDLSRVGRDAPPGAIEQAILHSAPRWWLWNRLAEAAEAEIRAELDQAAAQQVLAREQALAHLGQELAAAGDAPQRTLEPAQAWTMQAVGDAGLAGTLGVVIPGDNCFAVAREVWQSHLVWRHLLGGIPFAEPEALISLRSMLRREFSVAAPGGFEWRTISESFPNLRPPSDVVVEYARMLALVGLLARGPDGLWRPTRLAAAARERRETAGRRHMTPPKAQASGCR